MNFLDLEGVIELSDYEMFETCRNLLQKNFGHVHTDEKHNYLYSQGNSGTCYVAHLDTIRGSLPVEFVRCKGRIFNMYGVLGADDRVGIYLLTEILEYSTVSNAKIPSILITNYEESGMLGMKSFLKTNYLTSTNTDLIVALDRAGFMQYTSYHVELPASVLKYINSYGFKKIESKKRSDVVLLHDASKIPIINFGIGYYFEHTDVEHVVLKECYKTLDVLIKMIDSPYER